MAGGTVDATFQPRGLCAVSSVRRDDRVSASRRPEWLAKPPAGWAAILVAGDRELELSGGEVRTTHNRQELLAVINGLRALLPNLRRNYFAKPS